jgi:hypothetical protein
MYEKKRAIFFILQDFAICVLCGIIVARGEYSIFLVFSLHWKKQNL